MIYDVVEHNQCRTPESETSGVNKSFHKNDETTHTSQRHHPHTLLNFAMSVVLVMSTMKSFTF